MDGRECTRRVRTLLAVEDGCDGVHVFILANWDNISPLRVVGKQLRHGEADGGTKASEIDAGARGFEDV